MFGIGVWERPSLWVRSESPGKEALTKNLGGRLSGMAFGWRRGAVRLLLLRAREMKHHHCEEGNPDEFRRVEREAEKQNAEHHGRQGLEVGE